MYSFKKTLIWLLWLSVVWHTTNILGKCAYVCLLCVHLISKHKYEIATVKDAIWQTNWN